MAPHQKKLHERPFLLPSRQLHQLTPVLQNGANIQLSLNNVD